MASAWCSLPGRWLGFGLEPRQAGITKPRVILGCVEPAERHGYASLPPQRLPGDFRALRKTSIIGRITQMLPRGSL